jgi:hypothetical protein
MAIKIGLNAPKFANKTALDAAAGLIIADLRRTLRRAHDFKLLLDQFSNADLMAIGYTDGTDDTPNETGYLKGGVQCANDLYLIANNQAPVAATPHDYDAEMRYVAGTEN